MDPSPGNYWAIVALESGDENGGLAFLDMDLVVKGFAASQTTLSKNVVQYVKLGAGNMYRPVERGSDYTVTPTNYDSTLKRYTQLAIVNARTRAVTTTSLAGTAKILWVPTFQSSSSSYASLSKAVAEQNDKTKEAIAVGGVALAFVLVGFCTLTALIVYIKRGNAQQLALHIQGINSSGRFKSVDSVESDIQQHSAPFRSI